MSNTKDKKSSKKKEQEGYGVYKDRKERKEYMVYKGNREYDFETGKEDNEGRDSYEFSDESDKLEGRNPVLEAIKSGRTINKIFIAKGSREGSITQIVALAKEKGIVINEVERAKLDKMSSSHAHQGV